MRRTWFLWFAFALCLAVVLAAMAWISLMALRLDEAEARARSQAMLEESVRTALWRIDSALAPTIAQESARPHYAYQTFFPLARASDRAGDRPMGGEALVPSPLLAEAFPYVLVHFQFEPDGRLTAPRVPPANRLRLVTSRKLLSEEAIRQAGERLEQVRRMIDRRRLLALLPEGPTAQVEVVMAPASPFFDNLQAGPRRGGNREPDWGDFAQRGQAVQNAAVIARNQLRINPEGPTLGPTDLNGVLMTPLWIDGRLVLARRVSVGGQSYVQGCLLDWPAIREWLLESVEDLLPGADLHPVVNDEPGDETRLLAALPVALVPGPAAAEIDGSASPIRLALVVAWVCVSVAAAAVAALVWGVIRLSARRAAFVSAVTHELRTPLTTFHMYTEMLGEGMIRDAQQQNEYIRTLRIEASRLSHLVENVLAYARLERGRTNGRLESIAVEAILDAVSERLADRACQAGMELCVEAGDEARQTVVRVNPSAVEQILFNLVDNACKYAAGAADRRIHLVASRGSGRVQLRVRDHGPGIARPATRRLFRAFGKSAHDAADSAPGIGLGLALSKRLARGMGGRLYLEQSSDGACFCLELPRAAGD